MKKITYSIENRIVWRNLYDTKLHVILNFVGIYKGESKRECENWLKNYKNRKRGAQCTK